MDTSTQKDNSPEAIRERVESKRDEFADGPEPGWQALEAAVEETRHAEAQDTGAQRDSVAPSGAGQTGAGATMMSDMSGDIAAGQATSPTGGTGAQTPPFNDDHPLGVGLQCFKCGAYNEIEAATCWNCSSNLTHSTLETPGVVESVQPPEGDEALPRIAAGEVTETDTAGGARPITSD